MAWDAQREGYLKTQINLKFPSPAFAQNVRNDVYTCLRRSNTDKLALAIFSAATASAQGLQEIKALSEIDFFGCTSREPAVLRPALANAPAKLLQLRQQREAQNQLNVRINGFIFDILHRHGCTSHRAGNVIPLPQTDMVGNASKTIARAYANGENRLPGGGHYVEWYVVIGGQISIGKRLFTRSGDQQRLWFTQDGTHGPGEWRRQATPGGDWETIL